MIFKLSSGASQSMIHDHPVDPILREIHLLSDMCFHHLVFRRAVSLKPLATAKTNTQRLRLPSKPLLLDRLKILFSRSETPDMGYLQSWSKIWNPWGYVLSIPGNLPAC